MTLVQASIANNGEAIIMVADRLLTSSFGRDFPEYESEGSSPKIYERGNVGIGFAGSALYADMAISKVSSSLIDFSEIIKKLSEFVITQRKTLINDEVSRVTGIQSDKFFNGSNIVPEQVRDHIYGWLNDFHFGFQCIVAGFDNDKTARICYIDGNENIVSVTNF